MEKFPFPLIRFETVPDITIRKVLGTPNDSEEGYILEVNVHYPDWLHDGHENFPLAPTKEIV